MLHGSSIDFISVVYKVPLMWFAKEPVVGSIGSFWSVPIFILTQQISIYNKWNKKKMHKHIYHSSCHIQQTDINIYERDRTMHNIDK